MRIKNNTQEYKNCFLIEDHHEALKIWRKMAVKNLDLVHLDAHIDFAFPQARPIEKVFYEASNLKDLKRALEKSLAYMNYERDFDKQTDMGNYIYPAFEEGIIRNFYWVVPGTGKEFRDSAKIMRNILNSLSLNSKIKQGRINVGSVDAKLLGRKFVICTLDRLPFFRKKVLLDIDTDFLVTDSVKNAENSKNIGKRKPWIFPWQLIEILKNKIKNPGITTVAYSVNGGYTPIRYRHFCDEIAYNLSVENKKQFMRNSNAAKYFSLFLSKRKAGDYKKAVNLNPAYRCGDNNYGPLYLSLRKFSKAQKEFLKILRVDSQNPACLLGLGDIALEKKDFKKAKNYYYRVLNGKNERLFSDTKIRCCLGLAKAQFGLGNFRRAKKLLFRYRSLKPLESQTYYLLGQIFEKEAQFRKAVKFYQDSLRLGFVGIEPISRILKISCYLSERDGIIKYIIAKYEAFKKEFLRHKKLILSSGSNVKGIRNTENKISDLEKCLKQKMYLQ